MSTILPRPATLQDIRERFEQGDHTEADFELLITLSHELQEELHDEKVKLLTLEMDNFFLRGGQIPNP